MQGASIRALLLEKLLAVLRGETPRSFNYLVCCSYFAVCAGITVRIFARRATFARKKNQVLVHMLMRVSMNVCRGEFRSQ